MAGRQGVEEVRGVATVTQRRRKRMYQKARERRGRSSSSSAPSRLLLHFVVAQFSPLAARQSLMTSDVFPHLPPPPLLPLTPVTPSPSAPPADVGVPDSTTLGLKVHDTQLFFPYPFPPCNLRPCASINMQAAGMGERQGADSVGVLACT